MKIQILILALLLPLTLHARGGYDANGPAEILQVFGDSAPWISDTGKRVEFILQKAKGRKSQTHTVTKNLRGLVRLPTEVRVSKGVASRQENALVVSIDKGEVNCSYRAQGFINFKSYSFDYCDNGAYAGDELEVMEQVSVSLVHTGSSLFNTELVFPVYFFPAEAEHGLKIPFLDAEMGQVLVFNGEYWVADYVNALPQGQAANQILVFNGTQWLPADLSELDLQGLEGPQGPQGEIGPQGPQGEAGAQGPIGLTGPQGPQGEAGAQGPIGLTGPQGATGAQGPQGEVGPQGPIGLTGAQGPQGIQGTQGAQGPQGEVGPQGIQGEIGPQGIQGEQGLQGEVGPQGPKGDPASIEVVAGAGIMANTEVDSEAGSSTVTVAVDVGTEAGKIPQLNEEGKLPVEIIPQDLLENKAPLVAYVKDIKSSGTHGGSCAGGIWERRDLNTLSGDSAFVSVSGNQFTLAAGTYRIDAEVPSYAADYHQAKLVNASSGNDILIGTSERVHPSYGSVTKSKILGQFVVSESTTFEIQHRCGAARALVGFGIATGFGTSEIYTVLSITKVK